MGGGVGIFFGDVRGGNKVTYGQGGCIFRISSGIVCGGGEGSDVFHWSSFH